MALIKNIAIGMSVDSRGVSTGLKSASKDLESFTSKTQALSNAAGSLKGLMVGIAGAFAASTLVSGVKDVALAGANLNAILSKTGVIFGDDAKIITREADKMAASVGAVKTEFVDAATSFGSVFKGLGKSQEEAARLGVSLTKLGMDLASFEGVSNQEAFSAISSALRGEFDPMEKFRVFLSADKIAAEALASGLAKTKGEIDEYAKKTATLNLILKQTADAQGDLARTAGDADNQIKAISGRITNFRDEAGMAFRPITEAVSRLANTTLVTLSSAIQANKESIAAWAAEAAQSGGAVFEGFGLVGKAVGLAADGMQLLNLALKAGQALFVNLEAAGVGAFVAVNEWFDRLMSRLTGMKPDDFSGWNAMVDSLRNSAASINQELSQAASAPWASEKITTVFDKIKSSAATMSSGVSESVKEAAKTVESATTQMTDGVSKLESSLKQELATFGMTSRAAEIYKLAAAGASESQLAGVRALDAQLTAKEEAAKLSEQNSRDRPTHAAALTRGSAEAYSAQLRFAAQGRGSDEPLKEVAKKSGEQVDLTRQLVAGVNRLVEKTGAAVAAQLFPI